MKKHEITLSHSNTEMCEKCGYQAKAEIVNNIKYFDCPVCGKYKD